MKKEELKKAIVEALKETKEFEILSKEDVKASVDTSSSIMFEFLKIEDANIHSCYCTEGRIALIDGCLVFIVKVNFTFEKEKSIFRYFNYEKDFYIELEK